MDYCRLKVIRVMTPGRWSGTRREGKGLMMQEGTIVEHIPGGKDCPACRRAYLVGYAYGSGGCTPTDAYKGTICRAGGDSPEPEPAVQRKATVDRDMVQLLSAMTVIRGEFDEFPPSAVRTMCVACRRRETDGGRYCGECWDPVAKHRGNTGCEGREARAICNNLEGLAGMLDNGIHQGTT